MNASIAYNVANEVSSGRPNDLFRFVYRGRNGRTYSKLIYGTDLCKEVMIQESIGREVLRWRNIRREMQ